MNKSAAGSAAINGLLVVDKPLGWSSMDVVRRVRYAAGRVKTGHAGTLDPLATGVLVCCLGSATRLVSTLMATTKVYEAEIDFSAFTDTDDREGRREEVSPATVPDEIHLRQAIQRFIGDIHQTPPAYSAIQIGGQRAYKMARRGEKVEIAARVVRIDAIELIEYRWPLARVRVTCGKGTYIRSLARDLGIALGVGGHLAGLRRTAVGEYNLSKAVDGERLNRPITQEDLLLPPSFY